MANQENNANYFPFDASGDAGVIKAGPGVLGRLVVHTVGTTATVILYDNPSAASGNILYSWVTADGKINQLLDIRFTTGLYIAITGTTPVGFVTYK